MRAAALGELVLVVGEDQIQPAAVDVDRLAEMCADHCAAFDVPARATAPPRAVPADLLGRARLPQHEVGAVALVGGDLNPRAGDHRLAVAAAQAAIVGVGGNREQDVALRLIGVTLGDQLADHRDHRADFLGRVRRDRRRRDPERAHVVEIMPLVALGNHRRLDPFRRRCGNDSIVDVGNVAGIDQLTLGMDVADQPRQRVEHHRRTGVADVGATVHRRATDIHGDALGIGGLEWQLLARHRVVKPDHSVTPGCRRVSTQSTIARPLALSSG